VSVKVREKRGKLYLDVYHAGKRTWEALHLTLTKDKAQNKEIMRHAEICRSKREMQLLSGAWDLQDPVASKKRLIPYLEEYTKHYASPGIVRSCIYQIKKYRNGEALLVSQVSVKWFEDFQNHLLHDTALAIASVCAYTKVLRAVLKKAVVDNIILRNPAEAVPALSPPETELIFLNATELQRLADVKPRGNAAAEVWRAFLFACQTGLRVSDIETLTWRQIESSPAQIIKRQKKTKNPVYIPLSGTAQELIGSGQEHSPDEKIFSLPKDRSSTYKDLKKWAKEAGVTKNVTWHTARRTFATLALENGVDGYTVAKLLGHVSINQVAKYAKVTDGLRRKAIAALPAIRL
jgi:integrase